MMAIAKTIQLHDENGISNVQDYIEDPEKTDLNNITIQHELEYGENPGKTTMKGKSGTTHVLVDGYKCSPLDAAGDFYQTRHLYETKHKKRNYKSKKPVIAVHLIQSFPADKNLDPRLVHQIGMELVSGLKDIGIGDFQAVVSTHMNTQHLHNHILLNAFSIDGSKKFCDNWTARNKIRQFNDELSLKYGLPILQEQDIGKNPPRNVGEHYASLAGDSWKEQMRQDMKACIRTADSFRDWCDQMQELGYSFRETTDGIPISMSDGEHNIRLKRLGAAYTYDGIVEAIAKEKEIDIDTLKGQLQPQEPVCIDYFEKVRRYTDLGRRRSDLEIIIVTLIRYLKNLLEHMKRTLERQFTKNLQERITLTEKQINELEKVLELMQLYQLDRISDISERKKETGHERYNVKKAAEALRKNESALAGIINTGTLPISLSSVSPMAPIQRQQLFLLSKDAGWKIHTKFDQISAGEAARAIRFLQDIKERKPYQKENIPDIFLTAYKAPPVTKKILETELSSVREAADFYEKETQRLSKEYKDFVFLDKNCHDAKKEYNRIKQEQKNTQSEKDPQDQNRKVKGNQKRNRDNDIVNR